MKTWTISDIPSAKGRTAIITGIGGLGYEDAVALARAGWKIIIAGRDLVAGPETAVKIKQLVPQAQVSFEALDLANLSSIKEFGSRMQKRLQSLDLLINNAGVMMPPARKVTADGFELQFGTNYLGHFALTGELLPLLKKSNQSRVVTVTSFANRTGKINFDDLQSEREYKAMPAYGQSKLAGLMFTFELQRRSDKNGWGIMSLASHPGISRTNLLPNSMGTRSIGALMRKYMWFLFQPAAQGALPTLFAATALEAKPGAYYGPDKFNELRGNPAPAKIPAQATDLAVATKLWEVSERLTGVSYNS